MSELKFLIDHREDRPQTHALHRRWAIEELLTASTAVRMLEEHSRYPSSHWAQSIRGGMASAIMGDAAFFEAAAIIAAGKQGDFSKDIRDEEEDRPIAVSEEFRGKLLPADLDIIHRWVKEGKISPNQARMLTGDYE